MKISIITTMIFNNGGCQSRQPDTIIIRGDIKNLPDGKVYLVEARRWRTLVDSATTKDGRFLLKIKTDDSFSPFMASIYYQDVSSPSGKSPMLINTNSKASGSGGRPVNYETAFYLEKGITSLRGDLGDPKKVSIDAGRETELMYRFRGEFGFLGTKDSIARKKLITRYGKVISSHPDSHFLLQGIAGNKEQYTRAEISPLFQLFEAHLRNSPAGNKISNYMSQVIDEGEVYPNLALKDDNNGAHHIVDHSARINMLIFWASWCGPCRKEIPQLKELYKIFGGQGLKIVSISIDDDPGKWKDAVKKENMPWLQLWVEPSEVENLKAIFRFSAIPTAVLTDNKGMKITSFTGYDSVSIDLCKSLLAKYLK